MMERRQIVRLWRQGAGVGGVLATLVRAEGSSYRWPGARLLIGPRGEHAGTISGGCLEAAVIRKAAWKVRDGSVVERYSMMFDDTAEVPFGLGCGGTVDLLMEKGGTPEFEALLAALERSLRGEEAQVVTWLPDGKQKLKRTVFDQAGKVAFASDGLRAVELEAAWRSPLEPADQAIYAEKLLPPQRLIVFGAGEDAMPVVGMAALLGWSIIVADGRAQLATAERFPGAERVIVLSAEEQAGIRPGDAVVVMTHSYEQDRRLLAEALRMQPKYIGLLGSRHRSSLLVSEVAAALECSVEECCEPLYAPVGLDLGGDGPEAIALAVVAEVQAVCQGKPGGLRRLTANDVAEQIRNGGASRYLQAQCALDGRD